MYKSSVIRDEGSRHLVSRYSALSPRLVWEILQGQFHCVNCEPVSKGLTGFVLGCAIFSRGALNPRPENSRHAGGEKPLSPNSPEALIVNPRKLEHGLRVISAGIPYTLP